jgi:hypothetical protein
MPSVWNDSISPSAPRLCPWWWACTGTEVIIATITNCPTSITPAATTGVRRDVACGSESISCSGLSTGCGRMRLAATRAANAAATASRNGPASAGSPVDAARAWDGSKRNGPPTAPAVLAQTTVPMAAALRAGVTASAAA